MQLWSEISGCKIWLARMWRLPFFFFFCLILPASYGLKVARKSLSWWQTGVEKGPGQSWSLGRAREEREQEWDWGVDWMKCPHVSRVRVLEALGGPGTAWQWGVGLGGAQLSFTSRAFVGPSLPLPLLSHWSRWIGLVHSNHFSCPFLSDQ